MCRPVGHCWESHATTFTRGICDRAKFSSENSQRQVQKAQKARHTKTFVGDDLSETTYAQAETVAGDSILEQTENIYDDASNVIETVSRQRYHNATGTGETSVSKPHTHIANPEKAGRLTVPILMRAGCFGLIVLGWGFEP